MPFSIYQRAGRRLRKIKIPYWKTYMMFTHLTSESPIDACCTIGKTAAGNSVMVSTHAAETTEDACKSSHLRHIDFHSV